MSVICRIFTRLQTHVGCCQMFKRNNYYFSVVARDETNTGTLGPIYVPQSTSCRSHNALQYTQSNASDWYLDHCKSLVHQVGGKTKIHVIKTLFQQSPAHKRQVDFAGRPWKTWQIPFKTTIVRSGVSKQCIEVSNNLASPLWETHMPYGITLCYLPSSRGEIPTFTLRRSRYLI